MLKYITGTEVHNHAGADLALVEPVWYILVRRSDRSDPIGPAVYRHGASGQTVKDERFNAQLSTLFT